MRVYLGAYRHETSLLHVTTVTAFYFHIEDLPPELLNIIHSCEVDKINLKSDIYEQILAFKEYFTHKVETIVKESGLKHSILVKKRGQTLALRIATAERRFEPLEIIQNKTIAASSNVNTRVENISNDIPLLKVAYVISKVVYLRYIQDYTERHWMYSNHGFRKCDAHLKEILEEGITPLHDISHLEEDLIEFITKEICNHTEFGEELAYITGTLPEWWRVVFNRKNFRECVPKDHYEQILAAQYTNNRYSVNNFWIKLTLPCRFPLPEKFIKFVNDNPPYIL